MVGVHIHLASRGSSRGCTHQLVSLCLPASPCLPPAVTHSASTTCPTAPLPAGAAWWEEGGGRLAVLGSAAMFDDEWLGREDNTPLLDFLVGCLFFAECTDVWSCADLCFVC